MNKALIYSHFGSKDALFDVVVDATMRRMVEVVPISADDLADWAVRLYDEYLDRPDLIRLATWARLERRPAGHLRDSDAQRELEQPKTAAIAAAQRDGELAGAAQEADPFDVMAMVIAMSMAWSPVSNVYAATRDEGAAVHDRRRAFLRDCVHRMLSSGAGAAAGGGSAPTAAGLARP